MGIFEPGPVVKRIELASEPEFDLGSMRVRPGERSVVVNGRMQELQPRVMQVLVALAQARPAVVSRDRLITQCWDGRIVSDDAVNRVIHSLRHLAHVLPVIQKPELMRDLDEPRVATTSSFMIATSSTSTQRNFC